MLRDLPKFVGYFGDTESPQPGYFGDTESSQPGYFGDTESSQLFPVIHNKYISDFCVK